MTLPALRIALPKGRLTKQTLDALRRADVLDISEESFGRRLVVPCTPNPSVLHRPVEFLLLKNQDVPTYVEHGVAELGVCGSDVLEEARAEVFRPHTFPFGRCRIALAGRRDVDPAGLAQAEVVRIATKYPEITRRTLGARGWQLQILPLGGSVELAATLGLADAIVDLVETGTTLRENHLEIIEVLDTTRVHLIANRALCRRDAQDLMRLLRALGAEITTEET